MFIQYKDTNVHAMPQLAYRPVRVKNKKTGKARMVDKLVTDQAPQDVFWLRPGWNEFPKKIWDQNSTHPQIVRMMKRKKIVLLTDTVEVKKGGKKVKLQVGLTDVPIRLRWFDAKRAIEILKNTLNRDLLQRWLDEETRSPVKRALEAQIKPLLPENQAPKDEEAEEEEEFE